MWKQWLSAAAQQAYRIGLSGPIASHVWPGVQRHLTTRASMDGLGARRGTGAGTPPHREVAGQVDESSSLTWPATISVPPRPEDRKEP
ncbi:hypothetical protein GCM10009715_14100 [Paeniglutamicibacter psychrophenolicus]|uniref:Uncharacterized protein n=1 Tax=Paeniglutamicibacter psychrophenolicus TaxID=257454 RepID=A0ABS4WBT5_9MICC|nr:hypothetical protein [Paeniglutamicibacter psychrophenolicus]MBP2373652.1 hypothetical protein [Paeniglutamicibacter psychrophenolicus]